METPKYISHLQKKDKLSDKWIFQSNEEHSKGVATLASSFAKKIGFEDWQNNCIWCCCIKTKQRTNKYC